jgi:hypothetical protein
MSFRVAQKGGGHRYDFVDALFNPTGGSEGNDAAP